jgi:parvulin-like peptidyl-prolyl isomerase
LRRQHRIQSLVLACVGLTLGLLAPGAPHALRAQPPSGGGFPYPATPYPDTPGYAQYPDARPNPVPVPGAGAPLGPLPMDPGQGTPGYPAVPAPYGPPAGNAYSPPPAAAPYFPGAAANVPEQNFRAELPRGQQVLAEVGGEWITTEDVLPGVDHFLKQQLKKVDPQKAPRDEIEKVRKQILRQKLKAYIETRQVLVSIRQKIPEEQYKGIRQKFGEAFEQNYVKNLLKEHKLSSRRELEEKSLELFGVPFARMKEEFVDQVLAANWVNQMANPGKEEDISHAELVAYYRQHEPEYEFKAKVLWEQITLEYGAKRPREQALQGITQFGHAIVGGASFAEIAKAYSDGATAKDGGARDWTEQGALVSEKLDQVLFQLNPGDLSPIIEDNGALHIVRVRERRPAGKTSFAEAQKKISEKLKKERLDKRRKEILVGIREKIPVRNYYEESFVAETRGGAERR